MSKSSSVDREISGLSISAASGLRTLSDAFYRRAAHRMCQHQGKGSAQGKQLERLRSDAFAYRLQARRTFFFAGEGPMFVADKNLLLLVRQVDESGAANVCQPACV